MCEIAYFYMPRNMFNQFSRFVELHMAHYSYLKRKEDNIFVTIQFIHCKIGKKTYLKLYYHGHGIYYNHSYCVSGLRK